jgi:hypothetical protein
MILKEEKMKNTGKKIMTILRRFTTTFFNNRPP